MGVEVQPHYLTTTADGRYVLDLTQLAFEPWQTPLILAGWEGSTVQFRRDPFGHVWLRGAVGPPSAGAPVGPGPACALPEGYYPVPPSGQWVVPGPGYLTVATLTTGGAIYINDVINPFELIDLDAVNFSST